MFETSHTVSERASCRYVDTDPTSVDIPILLLHGMMGGAGNWEDTITALASRGYRALVPLLPIYTMPLCHTTLDGLVRFVCGFLDELEVSRAVIAGNSLGGHIAVLFALRHPDRTEALVLSGASGIYEVDMGTSVMKRSDREYLRSRIARSFYDPAMCTDQLLDYVIETLNDRDRAVRLIRFARAIQDGGVKDLLSEVQAPTMLIWGREDQITPLEVARTFQQEIQNARLRLIDECGHAPMIEKPEEFNRIFLDFLKTAVPAGHHAMAT